jgi:hypothetical protein
LDQMDQRLFRAADIQFGDAEGNPGGSHVGLVP